MRTTLPCLRACFRGGVRGPEPVEARVRVASPDVVTSPMTSRRAALHVVEVFEREGPIERSVGSVVVGDTLTLRSDDDVAVTLVARRTRFVFGLSSPSFGAATPLGRFPPELIPVMRKATGRGELSYREHPLVHGSAVLLRAVIETAGPTLVVRDDLAPVIVSLE